MPQIIVTSQVHADLVRLREFIAITRPKSAQKAVQRLIEAIDNLKYFPGIGQEHPHLKDLRQLNVAFEKSGYRVFYRYLDVSDAVVILKISHAKEIG